MPLVMLSTWLCVFLCVGHGLADEFLNSKNSINTADETIYGEAETADTIAEGSDSSRKRTPGKSEGDFYSYKTHETREIGEAENRRRLDGKTSTTTTVIATLTSTTADITTTITTITRPAITTTTTTEKKYSPSTKSALKDAILRCAITNSYRCSLKYTYDDPPDISEWDVTRITNMDGLFESMNFNPYYRSDSVYKWDVSRVTTMNKMFFNVKSAYHFGAYKWDVSRVTDMAEMFSGAEKFNADLHGWDVSRVKDMRAMFSFALKFNGDISKWDVSRVTNMAEMFNRGDNFKIDISEWDVSSVKDMRAMFKDAWGFKADISKWDVSRVTNMADMFDGANSFIGDISNWIVSRVTDMSEMFRSSDNFNADISKWDVSRVKDMSDMFAYSKKFNQDISKWDVSRVTNMAAMFAHAKSFNQNLCGKAWVEAQDNSYVEKSRPISGYSFKRLSMFEGSSRPICATTTTTTTTPTTTVRVCKSWCQRLVLEAMCARLETCGGCPECRLASSGSDINWNQNSNTASNNWNFNMPMGATIILSVGFGGLTIIIGIAVVFYCKTCMARMSKKKIHTTGPPATAPTV